MNEDQVRAAFEAWIKRDMPRLSLVVASVAAPFVGYAQSETQTAWIAYRAAYAQARREALEEAAKVPRQYAEQLDKIGWGNRFPDELTAIFNASTNMAGNIRALIKD